MAVGPVHAGVIEPGHFRFQCHGEHVFTWRSSLGYQHRGVERLLVGGPDRRTVTLVESIAGDTAVGHALASANAVEALAGCQVPARAAVLRGRRAGAGAARQPRRRPGRCWPATSASCPRPATAGRCAPTSSTRSPRSAATGSAAAWSSRGRALRPRPGAASRLADRLPKAWEKVEGATRLLFESPSVRNRFDGTGRADPRDLRGAGPGGSRGAGLRGLRATCGATTRSASSASSTCPWSPARPATSSRARWVRRLEAERSRRVRARASCARCPAGRSAAPCPLPGPAGSWSRWSRAGAASSATWSRPTATGGFARYKVVDPSFHNWMGLAMALRGEQISDFPLCNKSFNLSYCGHDL